MPLADVLTSIAGPDPAEVLKAVQALTPEQRAKLAAQSKAHIAAHSGIVPVFTPLPGPQTDAYLSKADVMLYGGSAGSAKTALVVGLAVNEHKRSIIFRRESSQTDGLESFGKEIIKDAARFNGVDLEWNWPDGRSLKLAGMQQADDWRKHAGRERDFIGFDEAGEFLESQVSSIMAWLRAEPGRRTRLVLASNPPRGNDGAWMLEWFAPWLDANHPRRAGPGELRWCYMWKGETVWVDGPGAVYIDGEPEPMLPMSRTFIPAALKDNPYRNTPEYRAKLNSLEEPLRSQLMYGDFGAGQQDHEWQAVPTEWVRAAQRRWMPNPPQGVPMCAMGVDVAISVNGDKVVMAPRYDGWYDKLIVEPGNPNGADLAGRIIAKRRNNAKVVIDVGGGFGADAHGHLRANEVDSYPYMGLKDSAARTDNKQHRFFNIRSEATWRFREALDPNQPGGSPIFLPPDKMLEGDLTALRYKYVKGGLEIQVEAKTEVIKRLERSTDRGDAVIMAWHTGAKMSTDYRNWKISASMIPGGGHKIITGRQALTAKRGK